MMIINYLHSKGFVYRDLKLNNVIIDKNKRAYLIDFDRMHKITESLDPKEITVSFDSAFFNQDNNGVISYFDDIYSLYMMIYYILNEEYPDKKYKEMINDDKLRHKKFPIYDIMLSFYLSNYSFIDVSLIPDDPPVQYDLGNMHLTDKYNIKDINKAIYYYSLAANQNHPKAQCNLGFIYYEGQYISRDINKSIYYYSLAANQNYPQAQYNLGVIYYLGQYISRDINKSIYYYSLAANQNHPKAQIILGLYFIEFENKFIKGIDLLIQSSTNDNIQAHFCVGFFYQEGKHVQKNIKKSIHYYKDHYHHLTINMRKTILEFFIKMEMKKKFHKI